MAKFPLTHPYFKWAARILGAIMLLGIVTHIWLTYYIERTLEKIVEVESESRLKLKVKKASFLYSSRELNIEGFDLTSTPQPGQHATYRFQIANFRLKLQSLSAFIFDKKLLIDSVRVNAPQVTVELLNTKNTPRERLSLSHEIGNVYTALEKALSLLKLTRFQIDEGSFSLVNRMLPNQPPLQFTHIQFIIDNMKIDSLESVYSNRFLSADSIILRSHDQNLMLPDGSGQVSFSRLRFNSGLRLIELDSCTFAKTDILTQEPILNLHFDTLRLTNLDFSALYVDSKIKADSIYCIQPRMKALLQVKKKNKANADSTDLRETIRNFTETADVRYIGVKNAQLDVTTRKDNRSSNSKASDTNFELYGLKTGNNFSNGYSFDSLKISLRNNEFHTADSFYKVSFESIEVQKDWLALQNMKLTTNPTAGATIKREHRVKSFILQGVDWAELIFAKKLIARKATLLEPEIHRWSSGPVNAASKKNAVSFASILARLQKEIDLQEFEVIRGNLSLDLKEGSGIRLEKTDLLLLPNVMLASEGLEYIQSAVKQLRFQKGEYYNGSLKVNLKQGLFMELTRTLTVKEATVKQADKGRNISLYGLETTGFSIDPQSKSIQLRSLGWRSGQIDVLMEDKTAAPGKKEGASKAGPIRLEHLQAGPTTISLHWPGQKKMSTELESIDLLGLRFQKGEKPVVRSAAAKGNTLQWESDGMKALVAAYAINKEDRLTLEGVNLEQIKGPDSLLLSFPSLQLKASLQSLLQGNYAVDEVTLQQPDIYIRKHSLQAKTNSRKKPVIQVGALEVKEARLNGILFHPDRSDTVLLSASLQLQGLSLDEKELLTLKKAGLQLVPEKISRTGKEEIKSLTPVSLTLSSAQVNTKEAKESWSLHLDELVTGPLHFTKKKNDSSSTRFDITGLHLQQLPVSAQAVKNIPLWLGESGDWSVKPMSATITTRSGQILIQDFSYEARSLAGRIGSFRFLPNQTREEFARSQPFQTTHVQGASGSITFRNFNAVKYAGDSVFHIPYISIQHPRLFVYRDKTKPFKHGVYRHLPVNQLKALKLPIQVDTVQVMEGRVVYTELAEKTKDTGSIVLGSLNATVQNLKNTGITSTDSLRLQARLKLMDSAQLRLRFAQSYMDSLAAFTLTVRMPQADLTVLNAFTIPVAGIRLKSGRLDSLTLRAIGREHLSLGLMKMMYHNLKVEFVKNGQEQKRNFMTRLTSFLANKLVIKTNNTKRVGRIYYPRDLERAVFHYWVKMSLSGMASSTGTKSNRKLLRKYRKELKKNQLPPIHFDDAL